MKVSDGRFEMVLEKKFSLHLSLAALDLELAFNVDSVPNSVKISYALNDDEIGSTQKRFELFICTRYQYPLN